MPTVLGRWADEEPGAWADPELASFRAPARRLLVRVVSTLAGSAIIVVAVVAAEPWVMRVAQGEADMWGEPRFAPPEDVDPAAFGAIDLERVHGRSLPAWIFALGRSNREREQAYYDALRRDIEPDANLIYLADELRHASRARTAEGARRMDWLLWAWNDYLDQRAAPYRIEATLYLRRTGAARLRTRSYRVMSDVSNQDGYRVRLLSRLDRTNVVEGFLGFVSRPEDGALLVLDRILHFATRRLWPMLHQGLDHRLDPIQRGFARAIRADAADALPRTHYALLRETAGDQLALLEVADSIHARHTCGSGFRVWGLPFNGLPPSDQRALRDALVRSEDAECPEVTMEEATQMIGASERLGTTQGLEEAVESLVLWVARAVAAHELRHVADAGEEPCPGCPARVGAAARGERGYLASLSHPDLAALSLMQLCDERPTEDSLAPVRRVLDQYVLAPDCRGGPRDELAARAREASDALLGERASVALPESFPRELAILPRRYANRPTN